MLILSRKFNESILIDGRIEVKVVRLENGVVKLGVDAPRDVAVHRLEVYDEISTRNQESVMTQRIPVPALAGLEDLTR
jgi:carbon storage regulator